jgi:acetyl-CoA acetyltransferase
MRRVLIRGVGMTKFGKLLDRSMKQMGAEAINAALTDAHLTIPDVQVAVFGNCLAGPIVGQDSIRGETVLMSMGFGTIPMHNVENACATAGNALHLAWLAVASGMADVALAVGVEKANCEDMSKTFAAYSGGMDVEDRFEVGEGAGEDRSVNVDRQATLALELMERTGLTSRHLAMVAARDLANARLNPYAHRQFGGTVDDVLNARLVVAPITSLMSSPISDGAAAAIVVSDRFGIEAGDVEIIGSALRTRRPLDDDSSPQVVEAVTKAAYEMAGVGPADIDVAEIHDASVAYELRAWTESGLCTPGDELSWLETDHTSIGGPMPLNPSGGLVGRGHAVGASGIAQVYELVMQLRGGAGDRQVASPRMALAQIGGGAIGFETACSTAHILRSAAG